jgi:hypothetical protein
VTTDGVALPYVLGHGAMRYLVLYGSHDGDVAGIGNNGFGLYDRATIAKTLVYARGMTHNRFNTVWNECADYADARHAFVSPSDCRTRAGTFDNRIFAAVVHRNYANFFVDALLRRQLLGDASAEGALRGINIPSGAALGQPAGLQGPAGSIQWAVAGARAVDEFDTTVTRTITGGAIENANTARPRVPHRTKAYVAAATGNKVRIDLPVGQRDQSGKLELTFRLTSSIDVTSEATIRAAPEPDWEMRLISASGTHAARPVALDRRGLRAPNRPFFHVTNHPANVTKQQMDTLVLPLSAFRGATLNDVRAVEFEARGGSFPLILDSVAFV